MIQQPRQAMIQSNRFLHHQQQQQQQHNQLEDRDLTDNLINKLNFKRNRSSILLKENLRTKYCSKDQWWQLFDNNTKKFFYYNVHEQKTSWHRPNHLNPNQSAYLQNRPSTNDLYENETTDQSSPNKNDKNDIDSEFFENPVVIPLATKLIERINHNIVLIKKSKKFLRFLKKKLDSDFKYDINDLNIISTLTERLLNIQNILTEEEEEGDQPCSIVYDFSRFEMSSFIRLNESTPTHSSLHSPLATSCYSFKSSQSLESTLSMLQSQTNNNSTTNANANNNNNNNNNTKRRLAPRTNPNYVNVDFVNTKNGSLIKNTYVKLQDLANENEISETQQTTPVISFKANNSLSQSIFILLSLLTNTSQVSSSKKELKQPIKSVKLNLTSSTSSMNTICSMNMKLKNLTRMDSSNKSFKSINPNADQTFSLCSSSATLISDTYQTATMTKPKKKLVPFKSSAHIVNSNTTNATSNNCFSLNRKNLEKSNNISKAAATLNFTDDHNIANSTVKKIINEHEEQKKLNSFSLLGKKTQASPTLKDETAFKLRSFSTQQSNRLIQPQQIPEKEKQNLSKDMSASSASSLADMKNLFLEQQQHHKNHLLTNGQLNQRIQTIKRSFNKKTSFSRKNTDDIQSMRNEDLNASFESHQFPFESFELDSPGQVKKQNQTNLFLNNTFIDLNTHHHGRLKSGLLFFSSKKKIPPNDLLLFSGQSIQKPLIKTNDKTVKKEACEMFKLIQCYMGDRKPSSSDPKQSQRELICLEIMTKGWIYAQIRDELYLQLVKQTTENPNHQSLLNGWELIAICLSFFPPSQKFFPFLTEYIYSHLFKLNSSFNWLEQLELPNNTSIDNTSMYSLQLIESAKKQQDLINHSSDENKDYLSQIANACLKRLERIHITGAKKGLKKPTLDEIVLSKRTITSPSLFGTTLTELMSVQKTKCPKLSLPWIQTTLSEAVLRLNGAKTEGIFRVPGDLDEVNNLKVKYDQLWCSKDQLEETGSNDFVDLMANIQDPHLPASLLKLWYRELYEPLIPHEMYDECIRNCERPAECINVIERLPHINKLVFTYLIRFLKVFAAGENVAVTKMDANNLSMIMAPNCLRCKSNEPRVIMENTKKEMQFLNTLIHHLDTSCVAGII